MKIKHITYYVCQFCGEKFITENECKLHEAKEMKLTIEEYEHLLALEKAEREASSYMGICNNSKTRNAYEKASKAVIAFREKHNLEPSESIGI